MSTLLVTAHPDPGSLTAGIARRLRDALPAGTAQIADLAAEGFDPRFTPADRAAYRGAADHPTDVRREQDRIDGADDLVLVFPVLWWSMPALLKGWIDRVFVAGWAFDVDPDGRTRRLLGDLTVHLVPVAGDDASGYERHGYGQAMRTQIEHGIVDYCGARRGVTVFVHESEGDDDGARRAAVDAAVEAVAGAVRGHDREPRAGA